jgi:hypothetical protein
MHFAFDAPTTADRGQQLVGLPGQAAGMVAVLDTDFVPEAALRANAHQTAQARPLAPIAQGLNVVWSVNCPALAYFHPAMALVRRLGIGGAHA